LEQQSFPKRIDALDIIRGFALLGILLVNMPFFQAPKFMADMHMLSLPLSETDQWIRLFLDVFVENKFFSIFSVLFGLGFYIFMKRAEEKGAPHIKLYIRRLLFLAFIGVLHIVFLWHGDILLTYALAGFLLIFFYRRKAKTIMNTLIVLSFIVLFIVSLNFLIPASELEQNIGMLQADGEERVQETIFHYNESNYVEWLSYRAEHEFPPVFANQPFAMIPALFMFLIGLYIGKRNIISDFQQHKGFVKRVWWITLLISIPISVFIALLHLEVLSFGVMHDLYLQNAVLISGPILSLFYISSLLFLLQKETWKKLLHPLKFVGRMALTNYIMQSVVCILIFTGFGFFGEINYMLGVLLSVLIFSLQVIFSYFWLNKYRYGPLEWIWRSVTYGAAQKMGREDR